MEALIPSARGQEAEETVCRVAGVAHNHGSFSGEAGDVCDLQGREWGTNDPSSCVHCALQCFHAVFSAASGPHSDAPGQDAFNGAPVQRAMWWVGEAFTCFSLQGK